MKSKTSAIQEKRNILSNIILKAVEGLKYVQKCDL